MKSKNFIDNLVHDVLVDFHHTGFVPLEGQGFQIDTADGRWDAQRKAEAAVASQGRSSMSFGREDGKRAGLIVEESGNVYLTLGGEPGTVPHTFRINEPEQTEVILGTLTLQ